MREYRGAHCIDPGTRGPAWDDAARCCVPLIRVLASRDLPPVRNNVKLRDFSGRQVATKLIDQIETVPFSHIDIQRMYRETPHWLPSNGAKMLQSSFWGTGFVGPLSRWRQARRPRDRGRHTHHPNTHKEAVPCCQPVLCPRPPLFTRNRRSVSRVLKLWQAHLDKRWPVPIASTLANRFRVSPLFDGLPLRNPISIDTRQANGRPGCSLLSRELLDKCAHPNWPHHPKVRPTSNRTVSL